MIHILCKRDSIGARDLAREINRLGGKALRGRNATAVAPGDCVVNWGESILQGLNFHSGRSKKTEMETFLKEGVPTLAYSATSPAEPDGWLGRAHSHHEGSDLLVPPKAPGFWTRYENFVDEFRVHIFRRGEEYVSVRLGAKFPRPDFPNVHPWIRSHQAGWRLLYSTEALEKAKKYRGVRQAAASAVRALDLDFGAVDVAVRSSDGVAVVLEVNTAPGLEGRTLERYAQEILKYANLVPTPQ